MSRPGGNRRRQHDVIQKAPVLEPGQKIARVVKACGENVYEVENSDGERELYQLPKRLRFVAFIGRGSFVFVRDDLTRKGTKIRGEIETVVIDKFLKQLRKEQFWPTAFGDSPKCQSNKSGEPTTEDNTRRDTLSGDDEYEGDEPWEVGGGNPNRRKWDSESSDEESE